LFKYNWGSTGRGQKKLVTRGRQDLGPSQGIGYSGDLVKKKNSEIWRTKKKG